MDQIIRQGRRNTQHKTAVVCLALWCLINNIVFTTASGRPGALGGAYEADGNGRKGVQRVRRKLRHRGLQSKPRSASGAEHTTQHGNIFLNRAGADGKSITFPNDDPLEDKGPRRVVNPYELGVKGQGYLLRGHDDEASSWGSSRNSITNTAKDLKGERLGIGKNESSPQGQPKRYSEVGLGVASRKGAKEAGVGTKDKSAIRTWGDYTMEGPGLSDMAGVNTYGDAWPESTVYSPGPITPISATGDVPKTRDGSLPGSGGDPKGTKSKGKAPGPRTHDNGPLGNSTQLEGRAGEQNVSASEGLTGETAYPVQMAQPQNTTLEIVTAVPSDTNQQPILSTFPQHQGQNPTTAPVVLNSALAPPTSSVSCPASGCTPSPSTLVAQPLPQESVSQTTTYSGKGNKGKTKTVKGLKSAAKNEEELQGQTGPPKDKSMKATKAAKAPTLPKTPPLPEGTTPETEGPSDATTIPFDDYYQTQWPDGFPEPKGGNKEFTQPYEIDKKEKAKDDKARKWMPRDGKMKGVVMKGPRQTLPPTEENPLAEEWKEFAARSAAYPIPRPKAIYPPKKEPASDELIKVSGKLKKSGDKYSFKEAPKKRATR